MKQRCLGATGIHVPEIGFGAVEIGMAYGLGVSEADLPGEKEAIALLDAALDLGINFFDTARTYGRSEDLIRAACADRRDHVVISTKCRHLRGDDGALPAPEMIPRLVEASLAESLATLGTDYVDIFFVHDIGIDVIESPAYIEAFQRVKGKGLTRAIGVSTYTVEETLQAIITKVWDVVQMPFNLMDQRHGSLLTDARERNVGVMVRSVLFRGILTDRVAQLHPQLRQVQQHRSELQAVARETGQTLPDLAIRFALSYPQIHSVLVGMDRTSYLQQAVEAAARGPLKNELLERLESELTYPDPEFLDLRHWNRQGWL